MDLSAWFSDGQLSEGRPVEGVATERIAGDVDPVAALNDPAHVVPALPAVGPRAPRKLSGGVGGRGAAAVSSSTGETLTGKDNRLLRHLQVQVEIKPGTDQEKLREALGNLTGTRLEFSVDVTKVNEPVQMAEPRSCCICKMAWELKAHHPPRTTPSAWLFSAR